MHNSDACAATFEPRDALGDVEQDLGSLKLVLLVFRVRELPDRLA